MPNRFASGKHSIAMCDICGFQFKLKKLRSQVVKTKQINDKISGVDSGDPFEKIGSNQAAIRVQTAPAMTGFSQAQQESRARQMQGLTGFRSSRA